MATATTGDEVRPAEPAPAARPDLVARAKRILEFGPKDDDFLVIPDETREAIDREVERLRAEDGFEVDPATRIGMLVDQALYDLHKGSIIISLRTDRGVVVLAAGGDEASALIRAVPPDGRNGTVVEWP